MTKAERFLRLFERKEIDYLPSQITFADRTRDARICEELGLADSAALEEYLNNHIALTLMSDDIPLFYQNVRPVMDEMAAKGFCRPDYANNMIYDNWGMGIQIGNNGFITTYGPLMGDKDLDRQAYDFLPERVQKVIGLPLEEAVKKYEAPDPLAPGNFDWLERDKNGVPGDLAVLPSGYFAIYERSYALMGWEQYMTEIAGQPELVYCLMEKITDYRIKAAKVKAELGYKFAHHGDDLGTQMCGFFSPKMFKEMILPHYKRLFAEYKKYGQYIIMHSCGYMMNYLPELIDIGLDGWEPVQPCNDLAFLKREYGKDLVFWGGIDTQNLPFMTPEQTREMALNTMKILGKGGGYVIAPAQEIMNDVPLENVIAILETITEYRDKVM